MPPQLPYQGPMALRGSGAAVPSTPAMPTTSMSPSFSPTLPAPPPTRSGGFLRIVSPSDLDTNDAMNLATLTRAAQPMLPDDLGHFVRQRWELFRNHRNSGVNPLNERLLRSQRMFEGQYDPTKLAEIRKFGGSEVYSRMVAVKCRGATSLLRDVYLGPERPWSIDPEPDPPVPGDIMAHIAQLVQTEAMTLRQQGQPIMQSEMRQRYAGLVRQAQAVAQRNASNQAEAAANKIDDILQAGRFYDALAEFLVDITLFPFAVLKGPVVRMVPKILWENRSPHTQVVPQMFWERVDPFNFYWSPGSTHIEDAECIERKQLTRSDLNDLLGLPGYNDDAIRGALDDYAHGLRDWLDAPDTEAALNAGRESPQRNDTQLIDAIEYHGCVQGRTLLDNGVDEMKIKDPTRDYMVQTWVVGRHTIKTQLSPSPRQRHPFFVSAFEKVPGNIAGHGLPDILGDLQEIANATLRALVNNMSIASGPQVVINTELLDPSTNEDQLYPWKRWKVVTDPLSTGRDPVTFFQPNSNAQELMGIYSAVSSLGDDTSAIPRYVTGESLKGGAGRTASGLSMLMGNAQKVLQTVAANIDGDVVQGSLEGLYDMIMLTDTTGILTGEEQVKVNGVVVALQKETEHQKQLQFLQLTSNPVDTQIVGPVGRARVLRALATGLNLPSDIVPDDDTIQAKDKEAQDQQKQILQAKMTLEAAKVQNGAPQPPAPQAGPQGPQAPPPSPDGQPAPPIPGAKLAPDGNHYIPDPRPGRQGKYLMVK